MSFAFNRAFHGLYFDILDSYKRLILFLGFYFGKMWNFLEKRPFFRADMAGLGKYGTGRYSRIGVYRVKSNVLLLSGTMPYIINLVVRCLNVYVGKERMLVFMLSSRLSWPKVRLPW